MSKEHPIDQSIKSISFEGGGASYIVGQNGVTRIKATVKLGMSARVAEVNYLFDDPAPAAKIWHDEKPVQDMTDDEVLAGYTDLARRITEFGGATGDPFHDWASARSFAFDQQIVSRGLMPTTRAEKAA